MSIQLQIAIPLFVTAAALVGIAVWRKYFKPEVLVITAVALALGGWMTKSHLDIHRPEGEADRKAAYTNTDISLALANGYMLEDRQEAAARILKEVSRERGDDPQVLLALARSAALQGNYAEAAQLYAQTEESPRKELEGAVELAANPYSGDASVACYLTQQGMDPGDYGISAKNTSRMEEDEYRELVLSGVEDAYSDAGDAGGKDFTRAVETAVAISCLYETETLTTEDGETLEQLAEDLDRYLRSEPELKRNPHIRLARMQGLLVLRDYEALAAGVDEYATTQELLVLAELYVSGNIRDKDIPDSGVDRSRGKVILELCRDALDAHKDELPPEQLQLYEEGLAMLEQRVKNPGMYAMLTGLQKQTAGADDTLDSKAYLAMAKLEQASGNDRVAQEYISQAILTAGNSDDAAYRAAMNRLGGVISGSAGTSEIMQVGGLVDQALEHSVPAGMTRSSVNPPPATEYPEPDVFAGAMTQNVNERTATLNIGYINKDAFPKVSARVQIQSPGNVTLDAIRQNLRVYDCNAAIPEFTLEKVEFERSRIILLCDISGSMSGNESQLKEAIVAFAEQMQPDEEVCVIGFADNIAFVHEFSSDKETVKGYAESIDTGGGTALYPSVLEAGSLIPDDPLSNNVIIAMTDGQDGSVVKEAQMRNFIGAMAADKCVTLYTVGLGDAVDVDYLELMASSGNGSFLYAASIEQLRDFYDFIHGQLHHQYNLSFTAQNTTRNQRLLELAMLGEVGNARKTYYLEEPDYADEDTSGYVPYEVEDTETIVYGLSTKFVYKSSREQTLMLLGEGFKQDEAVTVRISGNVEYTLKAEYVDGKTYQITLPGEVCVGSYDLCVSIGRNSVRLEKELTVAIPGDQTTFRFGSYVFTALSGHRDSEGSLVLSGNVTMNGWLFFKGDVIIQGEVTDERIRVTDTSGSYICYSQSTAQGLAKTMAGRNLPVCLDAIGTFQLYGDPYTPGEMDSFRVKEIDVLWEANILFFWVDNPRIAIYPDALQFQVPQIKLDLPLQKQVLRQFTAADQAELKTKANLLFTATRIALTGELEFSAGRSDKQEVVLVALPLRLGAMKLQVDTLKNDYTLDLEAKLQVGETLLKQPDEKYFRLTFGVKGGKFDSVGLQTDYGSVTLVHQPIPVSVGEFGFELSGFSQYEDEDSALMNLLGTEVKIKFKVEVGSLDQYIPNLEDILDVGDISLVSMEDCEATFLLKEIRFAFSAKVKLLSKLDVGSCKISLGKFSYDNALIGFYNRDQYGLSTSCTIGSEWESKNLKLKLTGRTEITLGVPYTGYWIDGDFGFDIGWWLIQKDVDVTGDAMIGIYENTSGHLQFSVIVKGSDHKGETAGFHVYITKATGLGMYKY